MKKKNLPKISLPIFKIKLPSTKKDISFHPMTLRDEKILLIAQETKELEQIIIGIKQIIANCVIDKIDINEFSTFDIEYLLINIRARSVNDTIDFSFSDEETGEKIDASIDIDNIEVYVPEGHTNIVKVNDETSLILSYPTIDTFYQVLNGAATEEKLFEVMLNCVKVVVQGEEMYYINTFSNQETEEFFNSLTSGTIDSIKKFFETMPILKYEYSYKTKDGKERTLTIRGLETFFT